MSTVATPSSFRAYVGLLGLVFLLVFGAAWIWVVKEPYAYMRVDYPIWMAKLKLSQLPASVFVLGDSRAVSDVIPSEVGSGVVNLALPGSSPIETYCMAERVTVNNPALQAVIISFTPYQLSHSDWFWSYGVEYGLITQQDIENVRKEARALHDTSLLAPASPGDIDVRLESFLYSIKFPSYYFASLIHSGVFLRYKANRDSLDHTLASRGQSYFGLDKESIRWDGETDIPSFSEPALLDHYFDQTLELFRERNIPVYFVGMPHNVVSARHYLPGYKSDYLDYLKKYEAKYQNFHVIGDPFVVYSSDCFGDGHHLNVKGAELWSKEFAQLLTAAGVPGGPFGSN